MSEWTDRQFRKLHDGRYLSKVVGVTKEPGYPQSAFLMMDAPIGFAFNTHIPDDPAERERLWWDDPDGVGELVRRNVQPFLRGEPEPEKLAGVLIRDPSNLFDANAIEVHVPMLECRVGFIPAKLARDVAPQLDAGERFIVQTWAVPNIEHEELPGVRVMLTPAWLEDARRIVHALEV